MNGYYLALNASNVPYLAYKEHLKNHKIKNIRNVSINNKLSKTANFAPYKC